MNIQKVDQKIEIDAQKLSVNRVEALNEYMYQFMHHIPFENISVQNGVEISTDLNELFEKIVEQSRGGFCYELNTFFAAYIEAKGYETQYLSATVHTPDGGRSIAGAHLSLGVMIDGEMYIADVGFGGASPVKAMRVTDDGSETVEDKSGVYRALRVDDDIKIQKYEDDHWETSFVASAEPRSLSDFDDKLEYNQHHPDSPFVNHLIVTKPTSTGRVTMSQSNLTVTDKKGKHKIPVTSNNYRHFLKKYFDMDIVIPRLESEEKTSTEK
ncbi:arylamine N-acetyltransferase family protein [Staphylococcus pseudintermedius]